MANPERETLRRVESIFHAALERAPEEREAYVELACAADPALRDRVISLLSADDDESAPLGDGHVAPVAGEMARSAGAAEDLEGQRVGAYRLVRRLGEGGMGSVWLGERDDEEFERRVAVKVIKRGMDTDQVLRRFRIERRALGALEHPNIARLLDAAMTPDGRPAIVMEYVEGLPLDEYCAERALSVPDRLRLFLRICDAVEYAHQRLVVHRDLKPSNIFVTPTGEVKLIDFGIAKLLSTESQEQTLTATEQRVMTPRYASPEQIRGQQVTTSTDVFSLGVVLYELLTGRPPFDSASGSQAELGRLICEQEPTRPSTAVTQVERSSDSSGRRSVASSVIEPSRLRRVLEGDLDTIVLMAMRKEADRRYASVALLGEDIRRHLADLPVHARPDTVGYRTRKFLRRNRAAVVSGASILIVLIGTVGLLGWMYARTRSAEGAEYEQRLAAEARLVEADRVATFLEQMLESATPDQADGRDPEALRAILDAAERRVELELDDQPRVRARIEHTLGECYRLVGDYDKSEKHFAIAESIRREHGDELGEQLAQTLHERALLELDRTNPRLAGEYGRQAIETFRALDSEPSVRLADAEDLLACVSLMEGRYEDASQRFELAGQMYRQVVAPHSPKLLASYGKHAVALAQLGRSEEAIQILSAANEQLKTSNIPPSTQSLSLANNLAVLLRRTGRNEEALAMYEQIIEASAAVFGPTHRMAMIPRSNRATVLHKLGRLDEAESEFQAVGNLQREILGPSHDDAISTTFNHAQLLSDLDRFPEAEPMYRGVIALCAERLGAIHPQTAQIKGAFGRAIAKHAPDRIAEARTLLEEQLSALQATLGEAHPATIGAHASLDKLDMPQSAGPAQDPDLP